MWQFQSTVCTTWTSPCLTVGYCGAHDGVAAVRRNTQDITPASQIRGSFSRDNSPQKKQGKLVGRCTAHARERDKHQIEKTSLLTRDFGPHSIMVLSGDWELVGNILLLFLLLFACNLFFKENLTRMVFCYQNCCDLLWERIVLVIEKKIWDH